MKQKNKTRLARAAMTLLLALLTTFGAWAQVQIGDGTGTNSYLPSYSLYNYSVSQQIYTAQEIAASGTITSIAFYNGGTEKSRKYNIYMAHTTKSAFDNNTDWIELTEANLVYEGTEAVELTAGEWTTFTLDTPFAYNGTDNLVIGVLDLTGTWAGGMSCRVFSTATNQALYKYQDSGAFGIDGTSGGESVTGTLLTVKNQIILGGIQQAFPSPTGLTATPHTYSADLSWTENGSATSWEICINDDESNLITATTNPYTLDNLDPETTYSVKVRSVSGNQTSSWSGSVSFTTAEVCPDGKVCIGTGTATNSYIPTYTYYNNSLTQQIYTAAEIGEDGYILSVDFHSSAAKTRTLDIYMVSTDKNSFENVNDWIAVTAADKVFSGSVTFAADDWTTIEFDTPFDYDGRSNVALIIDDNTGSYVSSPSFYAFSATSQAIRIYSDETNYDPSAPSSYTGTVLNVKNRVRFAIGAPPSCPKPKNLAASNVTNHTATLTWTAGGEETEWTVEYGNNSDFTGATSKAVSGNPTVELTGLTAETVYYARVKANCSVDDASDWTDAISFETLVACAAPTNLAAGNITATSAEISWTGNADATSYNLRYRTPKGFNYGFETAEPWAVDDFAPCTTYDGDGKVTYSFNGNSFTNQNYTGACIAFQGDWSNGAHPAHSGNAFGAMFNPSDGSTANDWLILPEITIQSGDVFSFWCRELTEQYGSEEIKVGVCGSTDGTFASYLAGSDTETLEISSATWTQYSYDLSDYVGQNIKLAINCVSTDIFALFIDDIFVGNPNDDTWDETLTNVTSPKELTGLTPSTTYEVEVQAVYADGTSAWVGTSFITNVAYPAPTDLTVEDLGTTTATISWTAAEGATGYAYQYKKASATEWSTEATITGTSVDLSGLDDATAYNFRVKAIYDGGVSTFATINFTTDCLPKDLPYSYDFQNLDELNCWSLLNTDNANSIGITSNDGNYALYFSSYNSASSYDQYLISPTLNATSPVAVEFSYMNTNAVSETFKVGYSTTTPELTEFTWGDEIISSDNENWTQYKNIFPAGTKYVAIHYYSDYQYYLMVDDFSFTVPEAEITFAAEGYATYYNSEYDAILPAGMKAKIVTAGTAVGTDDASLQYETIADGNTNGNIVSAGNAVMLQVAQSEAARTLSIGLAPASDGFLQGNFLHGSDVEVDIATLADYSADNNYYYMLSYDADGENIGWYWDKDNTSGTGFTSGAHKAWLVLPKSVFLGSGAPFLGLPDWEETTGIVPVGVNPEDGEWYTLQGLKVGKKPTTTGVYIHNGRKVIIK